MSAWKSLANDTPTMLAILAIVAVAVLGTPSGSLEVVIGALAGLGGYRTYKGGAAE